MRSPSLNRDVDRVDEQEECQAGSVQPRTSRFQSPVVQVLRLDDALKRIVEDVGVSRSLILHSSSSE